MPTEQLAQLREEGSSSPRSVEAIRFGPDEALPLFVGFVHPGSYRHEFAFSYAKLLMALHQRVTIVPIKSGPNISGPRNDVVRAFLQTDNAYLLFVDADIEFEPEQVDALLAHELPVVGGAYLNRFDPEEEPTIVCSYHLGDGVYGHGEVLPVDHGLIKVSGLGMGFTLIRRDVLVDLDTGPLWPFAEVVAGGESVGAISEESKAIVHLISEDITFCHRAAKLGYESWLDLDVRVKHHKSAVFV